MPARVLAILMPEWSYQSIMNYTRRESTPSDGFISLLGYRLAENGLKWEDQIPHDWTPSSHPFSPHNKEGMSHELP